VAVIGDSITAGGGYVTHLEQSLPRYAFHLFGGVGQGTAALLDELLQRVLPENYDEVIIQGGLNDIGRPDAANYILNNLERMVRAAKAADTRVILLSLTPWHERPELIKEINSQLRLRSPFWGVDDYVNVWSPLADERGGLRADLVGDATMSVHPSRAGQRLIGERIRTDAY
jgi:lysophospholipase L1-like esterase